MSSRSAIVSFSLDAELLTQLDRWVAREGYPSRSAALQRLVREELAEANDQDTPGQAMATLSFVYDHHARDVLERLTHLQHQHLDLVVSSTHVHLDHTRCLEVLILRGPGPRVRDLGRALASSRGVERARLSVLPFTESSLSADHAHAGPAWHETAHTHSKPPPKRKTKKRGGRREG